MRRLFFLVAIALVGVKSWNVAPGAAQARTVIESSVLRVEVTATPYSYAVIEKKTGQILLRQAETSFTIGAPRAISAAIVGNKSANALEATLSFAGSADTARVRWTFTDPAVVQVRLSHDKATGITESFVDKGERNYGLREYY